MTSIRPSAARLITLVVAVLLVLATVPSAAAQDQSPAPTPFVPTASIGAVQFGGVQAASDGRDTGGHATLVLGTTVDGLSLDGLRNAFTPTEVAAFRLTLPKPVAASSFRVNLVGTGTDGVETLVGSGDWLFDPSWDTMTGSLPAPPPGEYELRVFLGGTPVASAAIATYDVPRVVGVVTDPQGSVAGAADQVSAASDRFAEATDGQLWLFVLDTTAGISAEEYAADLWAVNADQMWPGDALAVIATTDADVAVHVGDDLGFYIVPQEVGPIEDSARPVVAEGRYADAYDLIADGLVAAFDAPPPKAGATPTPRPSPTPVTVRTPDFVGLTRSDAQALATENDLRLRVEFQQTDAAPQGTVIAQDPRAGRPVAIGGRVTITIASQPAQVAVPDVTGQTEDDGFNALLDAGLEPGTRTTRTSDSVRAGRIISTNPRAGVIVQRDSTVDYVVSRGPATSPAPTPTPRPTAGVVTVPDVRGLSEADGLTEIGAAGLKAGTRTRKNSSKVAVGDIISTDPAAGVQVARGSSVDYIVSRGPSATPTPAPTRTPRPTAAIVSVPQVRGMNEADALTELSAAGLVPGQRTRRSSASVPSGDIISTNPAAGVQVARGSSVDYVVSRGPAATPTPAPTPTPTPAPTPTTGPSTIEGDLLERIQAAGQIVVNVDVADAPWSSQSNDGTFRGYDVDIGKRIANALGVDVVFTSYPLEQVVTGDWGGRFDIAMEHLAITDQRRQVLDFSAPYAFDPAQVIATPVSGPVSVESFANQPICAAIGSAAQDWVDGTLGLTDMPVPPVPAPVGMTITPVANEDLCLLLDGSTPELGALVSLPTASTAIAAGAPFQLVGDPVFYAPVGIAADRSGADPASLVAQLDAILGTFRDDGTLTARSEARFDGLDLSQVPGGGPIGSVLEGDAPAFTIDQKLLDQFPSEVAGVTLAPLGMNGADLDLLLVPTNTDVSNAYLSFISLGDGTSTGIAGLALMTAPVVTPDGSAMLTAARMDGVGSQDLATALTPLLTNQYRDPRTRTVTIGDKSVTRISDGPYSRGDAATFMYRHAGVLWVAAGAQPLVDEVLATLP